MKLLTTFLTLVLFTISAITSALPQHTVPTAAPSVTMQLSKSSTCSADGTFEVSTVCKKFPTDTQSLRVSSVVSDGKMRYNSLRVYHNEECSGFGDIEPAWGCAGPGSDGCGCSVVGKYKSIRLVVQ